MLADDPRSLQLDELTRIATRLGLAFGAQAEAAETHERKIEFFNLFDRCFFSVRVSIALQLRMRQEARRVERDAGREDRDEGLERDPADAERPERYDERDREQDRERASMPILLRTLEGVAADAAALPGPPPAELPTLTDLLAKMRRTPSAPVGASFPKSITPLRARLAGSATTILPRPAGLAARRATGPP